MSLDAMDWVWGLQDVSSTEKLILLSLADRAGESHEAWPSWRRLELDTCLNRKTIHRGLKSLQAKGKIIKTGETKGDKGVFVYKLIGVLGREEKLSTTSTKNGTGTKIPTSTKNGTGTSTKNGTGTSTVFGTQKQKENPKREPKNKGAVSFFSCSKTIQTHLEQTARNRGIALTQDLIAQVLYYVGDTKEFDAVSKKIGIALRIIKNGGWNMPVGYKPTIDLDTQAKIEKEEQYKQDKIMMSAIKEAVQSEHVPLSQRLANLKATGARMSYDELRRAQC